MRNEVMLRMSDEIIKSLKDHSGHDDIVEIIGRALAVYDHLWKCKKNGCEITIRDGDTDKTLVLI